jgi:hypothetical protein
MARFFLPAEVEVQSSLYLTTERAQHKENPRPGIFMRRPSPGAPYEIAHLQGMFLIFREEKSALSAWCPFDFR